MCWIDQIQLGWKRMKRNRKLRYCTNSYYTYKQRYPIQTCFYIFFYLFFFTSIKYAIYCIQLHCIGCRIVDCRIVLCAFWLCCAWSLGLSTWRTIYIGTIHTRYTSLPEKLCKICYVFLNDKKMLKWDFL